MRVVGIAAVSVAAAVLTLATLAGPALAARKVALVIGNAVYAHAPRLANPLNDAGDIGAALGRLGFKVTRLVNVDYDALRRGLRAFTRAASNAEAAVVFYAGHGIEVGGRNFLVPVDAQLKSDRTVEFETVSLDLVSRAVEGAAGLGLVILDACRDNPFAAAMQRAGSSRSIGRGLARVEPSGEMLVAYAARGGTVAADGKGRNSPYTQALLAHLEEPGLEVGLMFRKVRDAVLKSTGRKQEPFVYGSLSSKGFYLAGRLAAPGPQAPDKPAQGGSGGSREHLATRGLRGGGAAQYGRGVRGSGEALSPDDLRGTGAGPDPQAQGGRHAGGALRTGGAEAGPGRGGGGGAGSDCAGPPPDPVGAGVAGLRSGSGRRCVRAAPPGRRSRRGRQRTTGKRRAG